MTNKTIKTINWLNVALSVTALILECMPRSVISACAIGPGEYGPLHYWSYFGNPLNPVYFVTCSIALFTIINLVLNIIMLFKDKKAIRLVSFVMLFIATALSSFIMPSRFVSVYNIIILIIFILQVVGQIIKLGITERMKK
ncbi:MAG: hypothetical protein K2L70_01245 [Clostridia bacterium]|nr:hypothetical protein [Clostridia bacterium]